MRTRTRSRRARIAAAVAGLPALVAVAGLAACGPASGTTASQPGTSGSAQGPHNADYDQGQAIVTCYRQHGDPGFPDQVYDPSDGHWHFGTSPGSAPLPAQRACQHLFPAANPSPPVPRAQFQALVRFAVCMRQHGVPDWPDPDPAGQFPLPPSLLDKTPAGEHARSACQKYVPGGGSIDVIAAP
jgi:hypothetical protein